MNNLFVTLSCFISLFFVFLTSPLYHFIFNFFLVFVFFKLNCLLGNEIYLLPNKKIVKLKKAAATAAVVV